MSRNNRCVNPNKRCEFFGNPDNNGLCSGCFKEFMKSIGMNDPGTTYVKPAAEGKESQLTNSIKVKRILPLANNNNTNNDNKSNELFIPIEVRMGDMTTEKTDVIVNAANNALIHASGLAGAIIKKGGENINIESKALIAKNGKYNEGDAVDTTAGNLPCKRIIHTIGPMYRDGKSGEKLILELAVGNSLRLASQLNYSSISLPAISSGIFGFPKELCAEIMFDTCIKYVREDKGCTLTRICFTNFDTVTVDIFNKQCDKIKKQVEKLNQELIPDNTNNNNNNNSNSNNSTSNTTTTNSNNTNPINNANSQNSSQPTKVAHADSAELGGPNC